MVTNFAMHVEVSICNVSVFRSKEKKHKLDYREYKNKGSFKRKQEVKRRSDFVFSIKKKFIYLNSQ